MISNESPIIKKHKNPLGIFLRIVIYPFIAYGVWQHNLIFILLGVVAEFLNWTAIPPVEKTFSFIQRFIDIELSWLNSPKSYKKTISVMLFLLFGVSIFFGLWFHIIWLTLGSFVFLIFFNFLMHHIAHIGK